MDNQLFESILKKTAASLWNAYDFNQESDRFNKNGLSQSSGLVFPRYRDNETRISEQELRFEFIHHVLEEGGYWYSIETPTMGKYKGFAEGNPVCTKEPDFDGKNSDCDSTGRSAEVDTMLYDASYNRVALIEFKANTQPTKEFAKDFVKMNHERIPFNAFIHLIESADENTMDTIEASIINKDALSSDKNKDRSILMNEGCIEYYCIILTQKTKQHKPAGIYYFDGKHISLKINKE